jgi:hypothetical protein
LARNGAAARELCVDSADPHQTRALNFPSNARSIGTLFTGWGFVRTCGGIRLKHLICGDGMTIKVKGRGVLHTTHPRGTTYQPAPGFIEHHRSFI